MGITMGTGIMVPVASTGGGAGMAFVIVKCEKCGCHKAIK